MATSRPVFSWPSVCTTMRPRRSLPTSTCCVSATPSSQGRPAFLIDDSGEAPVPPLSPEMSTTSPWPFETPAAIVPTPNSETSLTWMRASGFDVLEVVDQLRQVLDGVDVVVRRRRNQLDARRRVPHPADVLVDLVAGQLTALAGLGALGHLDLQVGARAPGS